MSYLSTRTDGNPCLEFYDPNRPKIVWGPTAQPENRKVWVCSRFLPKSNTVATPATACSPPGPIVPEMFATPCWISAVEAASIFSKGLNLAPAVIDVSPESIFSTSELILSATVVNLSAILETPLFNLSIAVPKASKAFKLALICSSLCFAASVAFTWANVWSCCAPVFAFNACKTFPASEAFPPKAAVTAANFSGSALSPAANICSIAAKTSSRLEASAALVTALPSLSFITFPRSSLSASWISYQWWR